MPLELPEASLPIAPYVLGAWLGDGAAACGNFFCHPKDVQIVEEIRKEGQPVRHHNGINWCLSEGRGGKEVSFKAKAAQLGVLKNKHIPAIYLRSSASQRLALLQGLLDTDGYSNSTGNCEFCSISERLACDFLELALTLGIKAYLKEGRATIGGRDCGKKFRVRFTTSLPVFRLARKIKAVAGRQAKFRVDHRFIDEVSPITSVPVRCIAVDSESHLYLAGRSFIPTHNTDYGKTWIGDGAMKGWPTAIFAPDYKRMSEMYHELHMMLKPVVPRQGGANKTDGVIRLNIPGRPDGRIDFWTLGDESAGRSRKYKRVFIDESAFTDANMMNIWKKSIEPTLLDYNGDCLTASNTNGIDPDNFLWQVCNQAEHGFIEVHEPSWNNPYIPGRLPGYSNAEHEVMRAAHFAALKARTPPLVWAQEYESAFVDWSGAAFFSLDKWLDAEGKAAPYPKNCDRVFAVIDSAVKTGSTNDGTAVVYFARNQYAGTPLMILDWDIIQVEGALLDTWLTGVFQHLDHLSKVCGAREGARGAWIEDKSSGMILLQQARKRGLAVHPIGGVWMSQGKDERALSVSSYHYQGLCKVTDVAHNKTTNYKGTTRNHLVSQVAGFRMGDKDAAKRADDLLDSYVHGVALALGDQRQF